MLQILYFPDIDLAHKGGHVTKHRSAPPNYLPKDGRGTNRAVAANVVLGAVFEALIDVGPVHGVQHDDCVVLHPVYVVKSFRSRRSFISSPLWTPQVYRLTR